MAFLLAGNVSTKQSFSIYEDPLLLSGLLMLGSTLMNKTEVDVLAAFIQHSFHVECCVAGPL